MLFLDKSCSNKNQIILKWSLCLIKNQAMYAYGGAEV
jgi:hypothetical protein